MSRPYTAMGTSPLYQDRCKPTGASFEKRMSTPEKLAWCAFLATILCGGIAACLWVAI